MKNSLSVALAVTLLLCIGRSEPKAERLQALPDFDPLPSSWYSCYLTVSETKALHHVYV